MVGGSFSPYISTEECNCILIERLPRPGHLEKGELLLWWQLWLYAMSLEDKIVLRET